MTYLFWLSVLVLAYTYFGYPLYLFLRMRIFVNGVMKDMSYRPGVSIIISACNEEVYIEEKLNNLLRSDYPAEKMEILIGSDGSQDGTNKILSRIADKRVRVFIFEARRGKPSVLNDIVPEANGEILIFCDVRQPFDTNALSHLTANFSDERVGCVSGELVFERSPSVNGVSNGVNMYWNYEKSMRRGESAIHSMVGATGAIYAIKRKLYAPPPQDTILDDVYIPLAIARQGYRCIWDEEAKAYDKPAFTPDAEYRRKVRTLAGNYQIFGMFRDLLIPFRNPISAPLISHKLLRVLAPFFMITLFLSNLFIAKASYYAFFMTCQAMFYILAILGSLTYDRRGKRLITKAASVAYMFCLMNFTAIVGLYRFLTGRQKIAWEK
ncbi:MAG: glycosyltransferase family 2 protein [Candidatus Omnitrophica bacterium]|nr:glycosyltransferase family 2 protein [Candidatus Omnitrophota bacterium]